MKTTYRHRVSRGIIALIAVLAVPGLGACRSAYYDTMEMFGKHKRDILVARVRDARDEQQVAKKEFKDALTRFREVAHFEGGKLEDKYDVLKNELDDCESQAEDVKKRIDSIADVSDALFDEWRGELEQYHNPELRRSSEQKLIEAQRRYKQLMTAMRKAEHSMEPVLDSFRDQVLFMKHNLNAQAIASLQGQVATIEMDVDKLLRDMEASIAAADEFIQTLGQTDG